jgi:putative transposase
MKFNSKNSDNIEMDTLSMKVRFYPTEAQKAQLAVEFGCSRAVWNIGLKLSQNQFKIDGKRPSYVNLAKLVTIMKKDSDFSWLCNSSVNVLQNSLVDLDKAYHNFFKNPKHFGLPTYKKKGGHESVRYNDVKVTSDGKITIPKLNKLSKSKKSKIKVSWSYRLDKNVKSIVFPTNAEVLSITVMLTPAGEYYLAINYRIPKVNHILPIIDSVIGGDVGIKTFWTPSQNRPPAERPKKSKKSTKKSVMLDRNLSKCKKDSNRRKIAKHKRAKAYARERNIMIDFINKLTTQIVRENQVICVEDLNIAGMMRNKKLSKHIQACSWGEFFRQLEYKCLKFGRTFVKIDRWFPSSKKCSTNNCTYIKKDLKLSERSWTCPECGTHHNRDGNAADNIEKEGLRMLIPEGIGKSTDVDMIGFRNSNKISVVVNEASISMICGDNSTNTTFVESSH